MLLRVLTLTAVLAGQSAWTQPAGATDAADSSSTPAFDLARGLTAFRQALSLAESYVTEHIDLDGHFHPGAQDSASWGRMHFKFYPQGRSRPHDAIEAETWIKSKDGEWAFQFRFNQVPSAVPDLEQDL